MARFYTMLLFALLVLVVPGGSAGFYELGKLSEVRIYVEKLGSSERELGLNRDEIKNHVIELLQNKLPRLVVKESADTIVYIVITLDFMKSGGDKSGYFGGIQLQVFRRVTVNKTGKFAMAALLTRSSTLYGLTKEEAPPVRRLLDKLLTTFAVDWVKDNP